MFMSPIVEDVWGGGDLMAIEYHTVNATNSNLLSVMTVIKIDFYYEDSNW